MTDLENRYMNFLGSPYKLTLICQTVSEIFKNVYLYNVKAI